MDVRPFDNHASDRTLRSSQEWRELIYEAVTQIGTLRHFDRRDLVFVQGDTVDAVYGIRSGRVASTTNTSAGHQIMHTMHFPNEVFGFSELLAQTDRKVNALALDDAEIWEVSANQFLELINARPDVVLGLLSNTLRRVLYHTEIRSNLTTFPAISRVASVLLQMAPAYRTAADGDTLTHLRLTHEELGQLCGLARQTVTTVLNQLRAESIVTLGFRSIRICDIVRLHEIATEPLQQEGTVAQPRRQTL